jgi:hypothetical protein
MMLTALSGGRQPVWPALIVCNRRLIAVSGKVTHPATAAGKAKGPLNRYTVWLSRLRACLDISGIGGQHKGLHNMNGHVN